MIKRGLHLKSHAGEIGFPGGGYEEEKDKNLFTTALRETREEIGVHVETSKVIAQLPIVITRLGFEITPFVAVLSESGLCAPGDTDQVVFSLANSYGGAPLENIIVNLASNDSLVTIINNEFSYGQILGSGNHFEAEFLISSSENMNYGDIPFILTIDAEISGNIPSGISFDHYQSNMEVDIPFG